MNRWHPRVLWQKLVQPIDPPLLAIAGALLLAAMIIIASASPERLTNQAISVVVALVVMRLIADLPPQRLMHYAPLVFAVGLLLLIAVALFGDISKGARRWLNLGIMRVQPSELMKIAMPMMLAWFFQQREAMLRLSDYAVAAVILLLPTALIVRQPDLGTAVLVLAAGGMSNKDIATKLGISFRTVEVHRSHIIQKTGLSNTLAMAEFVRAARAAQLAL